MSSCRKLSIAISNITYSLSNRLQREKTSRAPQTMQGNDTCLNALNGIVAILHKYLVIRYEQSFLFELSWVVFKTFHYVPNESGSFIQLWFIVTCISLALFTLWLQVTCQIYTLFISFQQKYSQFQKKISSINIQLSNMYGTKNNEKHRCNRSEPLNRMIWNLTSPAHIVNWPIWPDIDLGSTCILTFVKQKHMYNLTGLTMTNGFLYSKTDWWFDLCGHKLTWNFKI